MTATRNRTRKNGHVTQSGVASGSMAEHRSTAIPLAEPPQEIVTGEQSPAGSCGFGIRPLRVTKVLHVVECLDVGGTETQMVQVAQRLDPRTYHVKVASLRAGGPLTAPLQAAGIQILEFPKCVTFVSFQAVYQLLRLAWYIRREKIDVVHAHHLGANLMAVPAAWLAGAPVILSSLRNLAHLPWYTPFRRRVIRLIYRLSTGVIANSEAVKQLLVTEFRVPPGRVHVLYNGVDYRRFSQSRGDRQKLRPDLGPEAKLIVNVANMHMGIKGHADLIEAARTVCASVPQAKFVLVGDGEERPRLQEQVRKAGLDAVFLFLGQRKDIPEVLSCCDLFVLASHAEGLPNALLEAMAAGLPVVATRVGGVPEIIENGISGLLVPPGNHAALAEAILCALQDSRLTASLARAGQERVRKQFSLNRLLEDLNHLYTTTGRASQRMPKGHLTPWHKPS